MSEGSERFFAYQTKGVQKLSEGSEQFFAYQTKGVQKLSEGSERFFAYRMCPWPQARDDPVLYLVKEYDAGILSCPGPGRDILENFNL